MTDDPKELDDLRRRVRDLHTAFWKWVAAPTARAATPLLMQGVTLSMDLVTSLIAADAENRALRIELLQAREAFEHLDAGLEQLARQREGRATDD